ncbi:MAG: phenylacetate--CoA ligase family protein [Dehalococcoidia bacterium]|nr:phenylacetate--CoA ligase family protein [Dehalococcoidia bacterium]MDD5494702.1 phenylacetate--CoA ligase family protein [Dehalococcoidia bacterium]
MTGDSSAESIFLHDAALERLPIPEREKRMDRKLQHLIKYACENAPGFKARLDRAGVKPGDIKTAVDLQKIPVLRKDDLIQLQKENPPFGGYLAVPLSEVDHVYQSPGPIYDPQRKIRSLPGGPDMGKGQIVMNAWSYHITPAGILVDNMLRGMGFTVFPAGIGNTELQIQVMHDLKVSGFVGTPSFLATLIKKAEETGYDFKKDFNLKFAIVTGEMGGEPLRKMFTEKYGIFCMGGDNYATADVGNISASCEKNAGMHVNTDCIVEIIDPVTGKVLPPGEVGEVVVTPFDEVYPLVRFGTGDLSMLVTDPCECGRTTPRLPKIMGRSGEAVRVRGMFVHPRQSDEVLGRFEEVAAYQLIVDRVENRDDMLLQVELSKEPGDKKAWEAALKKDFQGVCKVRFDRIEYVKPGMIDKTGKKIVDKRVY